MDDSNPVELWLWTHVDERGRRVQTRYRMTEATAREALREPVRVPGSREVRQPLGHTSDWQRKN